MSRDDILCAGERKTARSRGTRDENMIHDLRGRL